MTEFPTLLPAPQRLQITGGEMSLTGATVLVDDSHDALKDVAYTLQEKLRGICSPAPDHTKTAYVVLELISGDDSQSPEFYKLVIDTEKVHIQAPGMAGIFYGMQTLLQLTEPSAGTAVPCVEIEDWPLLSQRSVHIDLRSNCLMPTFEYLIETLKELAHYKFNAIVLEWEDKFPYLRHPEIASPIALTPEQVSELLSVAAEHHIQVIPLIQTLGHVEYILKYPQYADLRERAGDISQFCPCDSRSLPLIYELLDELIAAHPDATFIHLGGDEPWLLGSCPRCAAKAESQGISAVYLDHIGAACSYVLAAGKIPMIWGDVVIGQHTIADQDDNWLEQGDQALAALPREVRMVYWDYHGVKPSDFAHFAAYQKQGFPVWVAPATRNSDMVPNYNEHIPNIGAFLEAGITYKVEGTLVTSWVWKNMPFEVTWHGLLCAAERAWSGGRLPMDEVESRAARLFFGTALPEVVEAMHLLSYPFWGASYKDIFGQSLPASYLTINPGHMESIGNPARIQEQALRACELLTSARSKVLRHVQTLANWEVAASLVSHVARKQLLFSQFDALLAIPARQLNCERLTQLRKQLEALADERQAIEASWREMLLRTHMSEEVERDNALRFAGERAHTVFAIEQLRVFELAEGRRIWR